MPDVVKQIPGPLDEAVMGQMIKEFKPSTWTRVKSIFAPGTAFVLSYAIILTEVLFPDVSFWQGVIDFVKMKLAGAMGVIIRAGQNSWIDSRWFENWRKAKEAGLPRGSYWFYDSRMDPKEQARLWASLIADDDGEMEHILDLEERYGGAFTGWRHWYDCLVEFQRLTGLPNDRIGIYSNYWYWLEYGPNPVTEAASNEWFARFVLWLAYWTSDPATVKIPKPWTTVRHWQKATFPVGSVYGVETAEIDLNHANMTRDEFVVKYGGGEVEPPPDGGSMKYEVTWVNGVSRRTAPTTSNSSTALTPYALGQIVDVVQDNIPDETYPNDPSKMWVKFADGYYGASEYPNSVGPQVRMVKVEEQPPAPELQPFDVGVMVVREGYRDGYSTVHMEPK